MESKWTVKGVKSFIGNEGYGFNATLYRNGIKVAFVFDSASGGEYEFHWINKDEHTILVDHCKMLPHVHCHDMTLPMDIDWFVGQLVDAFEHNKKLKTWCRTQTVFTTLECNKGEYLTIKAKVSDAVRSFIKNKYPNAVIINDTI